MKSAYRRARDHAVRRGRPRLGRVVRLRPVAVVLAIVVVVATAGSTGERSGTVIYGNLNGQDVRLSMPATDEPLGIAVFFHGQTGGVDNRMDEPWLQSLLRAGWIIASSDFHTASWGNAASTKDTKSLVSWAQEQTGEPVRLLVSGSMGATVSLNAMTHGLAAPPCWYGVKPAIDLTRMRNVPGATRIIAEAYGGPVPVDRNPADQMNRLPTETRYRMVSSYGDPWVIRAENTDKLVRNLENRGGKVSVLTVTGTHDDPSHFDAHDLVDYAATCTAAGS